MNKLTEAVTTLTSQNASKFPGDGRNVRLRDPDDSDNLGSERMSRRTDQDYRTLYTETVTANGFLKQTTLSLNSGSDCPMAGAMEKFFQSYSKDNKN